MSKDKEKYYRVGFEFTLDEMMDFLEPLGYQFGKINVTNKVPVPFTKNNITSSSIRYTASKIDPQYHDNNTDTIKFVFIQELRKKLLSL